jgi:hypothetical protein
VSALSCAVIADVRAALKLNDEDDLLEEAANIRAYHDVHKKSAEHLRADRDAWVDTIDRVREALGGRANDGQGTTLDIAKRVIAERDATIAGLNAYVDVNDQVRKALACPAGANIIKHARGIVASREAARADYTRARGDIAKLVQQRDRAHCLRDKAMREIDALAKLANAQPDATYWRLMYQTEHNRRQQLRTKLERTSKIAQDRFVELQRLRDADKVAILQRGTIQIVAQHDVKADDLVAVKMIEAPAVPLAPRAKCPIIEAIRVVYDPANKEWYYDMPNGAAVRDVIGASDIVVQQDRARGSGRTLRRTIKHKGTCATFDYEAGKIQIAYPVLGPSVEDVADLPGVVLATASGAVLTLRYR